MHDLKNLVSQLGLVSRNAKKYMDNPEFRSDMLHTLDASVRKMNKMLAALHQEGEERQANEVINIRSTVENVVREKAQSYPHINLTASQHDVDVFAHADQMEQVMIHIIQNAIDASENGQSVDVSIHLKDHWVQVRVLDYGCGMSEEFLQNGLFKPFRSTKVQGFGVGAFECREYVKAMGGRLDVQSREGVGTEVIITLKAVGPADLEKRVGG